MEEEIKKETVKEVIDDEKTKEIREKLAESIDMDIINEAVQNNKFEFEINDVKYRVRKPVFSEKQDANKKRMGKYIELLKDSSYILEADLKKLYKDRGIDIDELDKKLLGIEQKKSQLLLSLGKALKEKKPEKDLEVYKREIQELSARFQEISIKKTNLLEFSIENQVMIYLYTYLTHLISEKEVKGEWIRVWPKYEDLLQDETPVVHKASFYASLIITEELNPSRFEE